METLYRYLARCDAPTIPDLVALFLQQWEHTMTIQNEENTMKKKIDITKNPPGSHNNKKLSVVPQLCPPPPPIFIVLACSAVIPTLLDTVELLLELSSRLLPSSSRPDEENEDEKAKERENVEARDKNDPTSPYSVHIIVTGGIGHSTCFLHDLVLQNELFKNIVLSEESKLLQLRRERKNQQQNKEEKNSNIHNLSQKEDGSTPTTATTTTTDVVPMVLFSSLCDADDGCSSVHDWCSKIKNKNDEDEKKMIDDAVNQEGEIDKKKKEKQEEAVRSIQQWTEAEIMGCLLIHFISEKLKSRNEEQRKKKKNENSGQQNININPTSQQKRRLCIPFCIELEVEAQHCGGQAENSTCIIQRCLRHDHDRNTSNSFCSVASGESALRRLSAAEKKSVLEEKSGEREQEGSAVFFPKVGVFVLQDPTMQLRTHYTFLKHLKARTLRIAMKRQTEEKDKIVGGNVEDDGEGIPLSEVVSLFNYTLSYERYQTLLPAPHSTERLTTLLLGEIPRLRNDDSGYGPRGKGFLAPLQWEQENKIAAANDQKSQKEEEKKERNPNENEDKEKRDEPKEVEDGIRFPRLHPANIEKEYEEVCKQFPHLSKR